MRLAPVILAFALTPALRLNAQQPGMTADSIMRDAEAKGFSGVVLIAKGGKILINKGYGFANRAERTPFTAQTVVQVGSNTKDFTAVAILQLHEKGRLNVNDKLGRFFPKAPADKKDITIWQLLKHRAGFPLGLGGDFAPMTRQMLIDSAMAFKLLFPPGSRESYSNTGYSVLAAIIEMASGKTYDEYIRDNILRPAGLKRTGFLLPGFTERDLAHGYLPDGEDAGTMLAKPHAGDGPYWNLRGNGGMLSTAGDMHAFYRALFETVKLLKPETRSLMFNPEEPGAYAGSDLVNFFLYERIPDEGLEIIIASTNAAMKAPAVRGELARAVGLPELERGPQQGVETPIARESGKPVSAGAASVIAEFVATLNRGERGALVKFIGERFVLTADGPTPEMRAERLSAVHSNLGNLAIVGSAVVDNGSTQVVVKTEKEGEALLIFDIEQESPFRIRRFGIQVGG